MKKVTLFLFAASLLPSCVLAWNTPGEDFSGELKLEGPVTSTRNPWVWKVGAGSRYLDSASPAVPVGKGEVMVRVPVPALPVLLGKTAFTTTAGREGLSPRVIYGKGMENFSLSWIAPGTAEVVLPVSGDGNAVSGRFVFRLQAAGVLRHAQGGHLVYTGVYDDLNANGLPGQTQMMQAEQVPGALQAMFAGEGPSWLQVMTVTGSDGLSHFSDASLRQVEGVYGAQIMAGYGELYLKGQVPSVWHGSLPVSIEYQ
ncbi:fimbrial protein [Escherichia coli]|uniref:F4 family fimbrial subunit n=1 Tax=Escherichia coli TaxID=562 RepID=UPI002DBCCC1C|nr:fimbrial protein [Escherichia coli]